MPGQSRQCLFCLLVCGVPEPVVASGLRWAEAEGGLGVDGDEAGGEKHERYAREALFLMSASCEHPTLTPGCPLAVEGRAGVRDCREECHDVLLSHGLPLPTYDDAPARPVVRGAFSIGAPFDASALYLQARSAGRPGGRSRRLYGR